MNGAKQRWTIIVLAMALGLAGALSAGAQVAEINQGNSDIVWTPTVDYSTLVLTVSGPGGVITQKFAAGETPSLDVFDLAEGEHTWELRAMPVFDAETRDLLDKDQLNGDGNRVGRSLTEAMVQTGYVTVRDGSFVVPLGIEPENPRGPAQKDQVINDDLIIVGSACVGLDCVNGESFGFETIRLKENNLRIRFQDTSVSASFPSNDWQLAANDTGNGGANRFSIEDIDGGRTPFTVEASAPTASLYVDDGGRIGLGTATPVVELHIPSGDTPTVRLEQDGSSGFTPQTWDMAGNETNWFVRDATNGSPLPLRIRPSAPQNSLYIDTDGDIGLLTSSPSAQLDVVGNVEINDTDTTQTSIPLTVQNTSGTPNGRTMLNIVNPGESRIRVQNTQAPGRTWELAHRSGGGFAINLLGAGAEEFFVEPNGTVTSGGILKSLASLEVTQGGTFGGVVTASSFNPPSDVNLKTSFEEVDPQQVLDAVVAMPVTTWTFKNNPGVRHIGPMAQDFHAAFGLGTDDRHISTTDSDGVALAAIQALDQQIDAKDAEIQVLRQENADLAKRLTALEALVQSLASGQ